MLRNASFSVRLLMAIVLCASAIGCTPVDRGSSGTTTSSLKTGASPKIDDLAGEPAEGLNRNDLKNC